MTSSRLKWLVAAAICANPTHAAGDDLDSPEVDDVTTSKTYDYENEYFSIRLGGGLLIDYANYLQSEAAEAQMPLNKEGGIRDLRGLVSGQTPIEGVTYTFGYAWQQSTNTWLVRQTGLKIALPEFSGYLFLGRTKEGFSTSKFNVGYFGWLNERSTANDAMIQLLGDGARWTGTGFDNKLVYNVGAFADPLSDKENFNKYDWTFAGRAVYLPLGTDPEDSLLHLALEGQYSGADDGFLRFNSKPESFLAQSQAIDTGEFAASRSTIGGVEGYYVQGPLSSGLEYYINFVSASASDNPVFHGGEAFVAYMLTGETHPYAPHSAVFEDVSPKKTFFEGGWGAWEVVLRASHTDLDSGTIEGGKFTRGTVLVNWYLTDALRFEALYGYGVQVKPESEGTHFFQTRIQLQVR